MARAPVVLRLAPVALALLAVACSSKKPPEQPAPTLRTSNVHAEYVSGIAAAYYCTCSRWPGSWAEIRRFDDFLHGQAKQEGETPMKRYGWADVDGTVNVHADGSLIIRPKLRSGGGATEQDFDPIAVPTPECSRFDRARFAGGCPRTAATR